MNFLFFILAVMAAWVTVYIFLKNYHDFFVKRKTYYLAASLYAVVVIIPVSSIIRDLNVGNIILSFLLSMYILIFLGLFKMRLIQAIYLSLRFAFTYYAYYLIVASSYAVIFQTKLSLLNEHEPYVYYIFYIISSILVILTIYIVNLYANKIPKEVFLEDTKTLSFLSLFECVFFVLLIVLLEGRYEINISNWYAILVAFTSILSLSVKLLLKFIYCSY